MVEATTVIYVRDTEATDSAAQQRELAVDYATTVLNLDQEVLTVLSDTALKGRDAPSSSDQKLFELAEDGAIERVIVRDAARIATTMRDLNDRIREFLDNGVAVHIIKPGIRIGESIAGADSIGGSRSDPDLTSESHSAAASELDSRSRSTAESRTDTDLGPDAHLDTAAIDDHTMLRAIGIAAELEASVNSERTREGIAAAQAEGKHVGRPPFGFDTDGNGNLVPNENFETALAVIEQIEAGDSKRSTARDAGITRATVRNIMNRKELYRFG